MPAAERYTTSELLTSISNKGHIPPSQTPFDSTGLLSIAQDELRTAIMRQVKTARENYYLTYTDYTSNSQSVYNIPPRAIAGAIQDVQIVNGTQVYTVGRCETNEQVSTETSPTGDLSYLLIGNQIKIYPIQTSGTVRIWYLRRPNTMVVTSSCAQVTGVSATTLTFAASTIPSTFSVTTLMDCIQDQPHFDWRFTDYTPSSVTATTVVFSSLPTDQNGAALIQVGDWLALAGTTPVPQIPVEFFPLLVQRTVVKYYEIQGYKDKVAMAQKKLDDMERDVFELINPRVSSEPKRIIQNSNIIGGFRRWRAWSAT